jgi:type III secretory pathway component EscR
MTHGDIVQMTQQALWFVLLLFVLIDGWVKLTHGLVLTYV